MGGGGHLNIAGAQVKKPMPEVEEMLKNIIDEMYQEEKETKWSNFIRRCKSLGKKRSDCKCQWRLCQKYDSAKEAGRWGNTENLNDLKLQKANEEKVAQENLEAAQAFAKDLETKEVILTLKVGEGGRTFGSVSAKEISEAAKSQLNLDIDKKKLQLDGPIRNLGVTQVSVKLHPKVTGSLKVWIKEA